MVCECSVHQLIWGGQGGALQARGCLRDHRGLRGSQRLLQVGLVPVDQNIWRGRPQVWPLAQELQGNKDPVRSAALGAKVPGDRLNKLILNLDKHYFFSTPILDYEKSRE